MENTNAISIILHCIILHYNLLAVYIVTESIDW